MSIPSNNGTRSVYKISFQDLVIVNLDIDVRKGFEIQRETKWSSLHAKVMCKKQECLLRDCNQFVKEAKVMEDYD